MKPKLTEEAKKHIRDTFLSRCGHDFPEESLARIGANVAIALLENPEEEWFVTIEKDLDKDLRDLVDEYGYNLDVNVLSTIAEVVEACEVQRHGYYRYPSKEECILEGEHLETVDANGYCNYCGEQADAETMQGEERGKQEGTN